MHEARKLFSLNIIHEHLPQSAVEIRKQGPALATRLALSCGDPDRLSLLHSHRLSSQAHQLGKLLRFRVLLSMTWKVRWFLVASTTTGYYYSKSNTIRRLHLPSQYFSSSKDRLECLDTIYLAQEEPSRHCESVQHVSLLRCICNSSPRTKFEART